MDRKLRRQLIRQFEKTGLTNAQAKRLLEIYDTPSLKGTLKEGDKVRLNLKSIQEHPDWHKYDPRYKQFVEDNKDVEFTVQCDPKNPTDETIR